MALAGTVDNMDSIFMDDDFPCNPPLVAANGSEAPGPVSQKLSEAQPTSNISMFAPISISNYYPSKSLPSSTEMLKKTQEQRREVYDRFE